MAEVALNVLLTLWLASVSVWVTISARRSFGWPGGSPGPAPPPPACTHEATTYSWGTGTTRCADCGHITDQEQR